jgi:hypothetical protein
MGDQDPLDKLITKGFPLIEEACACFHVQLNELENPLQEGSFFSSAIMFFL